MKDRQRKKIFALVGKQPSQKFIQKQNENISDPDLHIKDVKHGSEIIPLGKNKARNFGARTKVHFISGGKITFDRLGTKEAIYQARKNKGRGT